MGRAGATYERATLATVVTTVEQSERGPCSTQLTIPPPVIHAAVAHCSGTFLDTTVVELVCTPQACSHCCAYHQRHFNAGQTAGYAGCSRTLHYRSSLAWLVSSSDEQRPPSGPCKSWKREGGEGGLRAMQRLLVVLCRCALSHSGRGDAAVPQLGTDRHECLPPSGMR